MKSKLVESSNGGKTFVLVLDTGDECMEQLKSFAKDNGLTGAHLTAIGAFQQVTLGYFDWDTKEYKRIPVNEQVEVLSLVGDVALHNDAPALHIHAVLGKADGAAIGGHLLEGYVRPTLETVVAETPSHLRRRVDPETGLPLINL